MKKKQLDVQEVATRLGVAPTTVYALCRRKQLMHTRIGSGRGTIRIPEEALATYLESVTIIPDSDRAQGNQTR